METGLWIFLIVAASAFTFIAFRPLGRMAVFLHLIAMVLWFGLGGIHGSGEAIAMTTNTTDGTVTWTETKIWIPEGEDAFWLTYMFQGFGVVNLALFLKRMLMGSES